MNTIFVFLTLAAVACAQRNYDPRTAAILSEQRYLQGASFGAQYKQEDGVEFKEESDQDGNRRGSYSYVDPSGQRRTVHYTAGKHGFMATGDHIPQAPPQVAPQPQYQPQPQYNPPPQQQYNQQPQYNPPQQQYNPPQQQYSPAPQQQYNPPQQQYNPPPQQQYNPPQYQHTTQAPHRFYPPGKLSLQRSPDGFQYSFNKS